MKTGFILAFNVQHSTKWNWSLKYVFSRGVNVVKLYFYSKFAVISSTDTNRFQLS